MSDDAMEIWRRELSNEASSSVPPPSQGQPPPDAPRSRSPSVPVLNGAPALVGVVLGGVITFLHGWPPGQGLAIALALVPFAVGGFEYARSQRAGRAAGWGMIAGLCGALTAAVIVPVWGFFEFLDCWLSWLSDC
jgi:hypothetical protein